MEFSQGRRKSRAVRVGNITVGGTAPVSIQSMLNTEPHDVDAAYKQICELRDAGCEIVRLTAPDIESTRTFSELRKRGITMPLVADIHFNYKIALAAIEAGVSKVRINPGNIGSRDKTREVVLAARERGVPIRIGVNSGSLEEDILKKYGAPTAEALAESALMHADILRELDFHDIILSVKASDVRTMIAANRILAERTDYPLHRNASLRGHRRYRPRVAYRASQGGNLRCTRDTLLPRPACRQRNGYRILPHLRKNEDRPYRTRCPLRGARKSRGDRQKEYKGRHNGMRCQRSR